MPLEVLVDVVDVLAEPGDCLAGRLRQGVVAGLVEDVVEDILPQEGGEGEVDADGEDDVAEDHERTDDCEGE